MPRQKPTQEQQAAATGDHQSSLSQPLVQADQANAQTENATQSTAAAQQNQEIANPGARERRAQNWLLVIFTGIVAIVTCVYAYFSYGQWSSMDNATSEAKKTRELEYRAYVGVKGVDLLRESPNDPLAHAVVTYSNTGRTPALNSTIRVVRTLRETPLPEDIPFAPPDAPPSKIVIMSLVDMTIDTGVIPMKTAPGGTPASQEQTQRAQGKSQPTPTPNLEVIEIKGQWYVYGVIEYDDIFQNHHQTKFCFFNTPGSPGFHPCTVHNSFN